MSVPDRIISFLRDGKWHTVKDVSKKLELSQDLVGKAFSFLAKYDFIEYDHTRSQARITSALRKWLDKLEK